MRATIAALSLAALAAAAPAQTIYRCGDSYGPQPCAGGKAIEAEPAPTAAERNRSAAATQRDAKLADSLEKDRLQREAQPAQLYIPPPQFEAQPGPYKGPEKAATRKLDVFTASAPASNKPGKPTKAKKGKGKAGKKGTADSGKPAKKPGSGPAAGTLAVKR
ncbi:hypothetical protein [Ramlibacter sp.]|uniref:hypothetical protein n=1 Tax=Ramlibacter sp. TaxID=1917967 RepID=UPI002D764977|nr:hypothetical protein [Ramlibacter sp.]HYD77268.1 hypothetical protein [Ramlibacter sp.]